ncbi:hypothetical protein EDD37DRAFT_297874 [Exophiala viscosa]|uniref:uncharacterized protein n=1 Tax=Exophiala viscosa TaxID=2486360 RepID=UPI002191BF04|nr:hypothetical protein EDD37DRAFT_297874 [Exophiala viscosa]
MMPRTDCRIPTSLMKLRRFKPTLHDQRRLAGGCKVCSPARLSNPDRRSKLPSGDPHLAISTDFHCRRRQLLYSSGLKQNAPLALPSPATKPLTAFLNSRQIKAFLSAAMPDLSPQSEAQSSSTPAQGQASNLQPGTTKAPDNQTPGHPSFRRQRASRACETCHARKVCQCTSQCTATRAIN